MKYHVAVIPDSDAPKWYRLAHEFGTVFNHPAWVNLWKEQTELVGIFDQGSMTLIGGFMLHRMTLKGLAALTNMPLTPHCGLFVKPFDGHHKTIHSKQKQIIKAIAQFVELRSEKIKTLSFPPEWIDFQPFNWQGYKILTRYTYVLNLSNNEQALLSGLSYKTRNKISKAERDGVTVSKDCNVDEVISVLEPTYKRNRASFDPQLFKKLIVNCLEAGILECYKAIFRGRVVATGMFLFDRKKTYYIAGGYRTEDGHNGAGALVVWNGILSSKKRGSEVFDFEGSMIPEVEKFFRGFGGEMIRYHQVTKAPFLIEILLKIKRRNEF